MFKIVKRKYNAKIKFQEYLKIKPKILLERLGPSSGSGDKTSMEWWLKDTDKKEYVALWDYNEIANGNENSDKDISFSVHGTNKEVVTRFTNWLTNMKPEDYLTAPRMTFKNGDTVYLTVKGWEGYAVVDEVKDDCIIIYVNKNDVRDIHWANATFDMDGRIKNITVIE